MRGTVAILTGTALAGGALLPLFGAPATAAATPAVAVTSVSPAAAASVSAAAARTEKMVHHTCDRTGKATVSVTWNSPTEARVRWTVADVAGGRRPAMKIVALDYNGASPVRKQNFFAGDGKVVLRSGAGTSHSGGRVWEASRLKKIDEIEVWIWNEGASCGFNTIKRLNDTVHTPKRTEAKGYASSKALRERIKKIALTQYRGGNHEYGENCSKYVNAFYAPNICQAWCADFAWWVWMKAGVKGANIYNSGYTNDFKDEWRVRFKPLGGDRKPVVGDVMVQKHSTNGINGHVGVVIATDGWKVKLVHGNWSDSVQFQDWMNPFTYSSDAGRKHVIGFASPA